MKFLKNNLLFIVILLFILLSSLFFYFNPVNFVKIYNLFWKPQLGSGGGQKTLGFTLIIIYLLFIFSIGYCFYIMYKIISKNYFDKERIKLHYSIFEGFIILFASLSSINILNGFYRIVFSNKNIDSNYEYIIDALDTKLAFLTGISLVIFKISKNVITYYLSIDYFKPKFKNKKRRPKRKRKNKSFILLYVNQNISK